MGFIENLEKELFEMQDLKYRDFHSRLLPGIDKETIIGIRTQVSGLAFKISSGIPALSFPNII